MDSGRREQGGAGPSGGSRAADIQSHLPRHHQYAVRATGRQQSNDSENPSSATPAHDAAQGSMSIRRRPSINEKTPARSFYHRTFHGSIDPAKYSSQGVRERTAELESLAFSEVGSVKSRKSFAGAAGSIPPAGIYGRSYHGGDGQAGLASSRPEAIEEGSEPHTPRGNAFAPLTTESALTAMLRSPANSPKSLYQQQQQQQHHLPEPEAEDEDERIEPERLNSWYTIPSTSPVGQEQEQAPLLRSRTYSESSQGYGTTSDSTIEAGAAPKRTPQETKGWIHTKLGWRRGFDRYMAFCNPRTWNRRSIFQKGIVEPGRLLPAVFLGLLLNILDALSYGMILFPLGQPIFASLGSDGISMFYVSTIIAQLVFSCGGSIFKGGIGSEMIEVVPFFHKMAMMILARVGPDDPKSVLATTILSYSISSVLTGAVFFAMGACGLGSFIGFFPRHILIGCIGGVGWFLIATGVEVSARLSGNLEYNLDTLQKLFQFDTVFLWTTPLVLAIGLLVLKRYIRSNFLVGGYFISIAACFYLVKLIASISLNSLRNNGWVFEAPSSALPWYHFYTLYDMSAVNWYALADTVPAMFALTFFGILHVPINVPALGISTGEDNLNVDRELIAHGISNAVSGFAGSIQNYLVYTNSLLFIASGGNDRLAGIMLAIGTFGVLLAGPEVIGYIPVMVVGALIYMLGIELMEEALVDTWGKLHRLEYITIIVIVVTMGAWDFVTGIILGIIMACVNFVAQASQKSAITATYTGQIAISTVRRHPLHARFLREAGKQTFVIKLAGFLFFGTIASVEKQIRHLIEGEVFNKRPIRFLVLDVSYVNGLDFSAAEALTRLNRILRKRGVHMIICGLDFADEVGESLLNVGLFAEENQVEVFQDLNSALEYCENELLRAIHDGGSSGSSGQYLEVPGARPGMPSLGSISSPRGHYLHQLAANVLHEEAEAEAGAESSGNPKTAQQQTQPLPLLMQTFQGVTNQPPSFWSPACPYFTRREFSASSVLYRDGDAAQYFYLLESGMVRAEYQTPQGDYFELIVAGRPCGELPFFGETSRTATVRAERDCVVWMLGSVEWGRLKEEQAVIALEMMKVCLKLTSERMERITSYVLTATR